MTSPIKIVHVDYNPEGPDIAQEHVEIVNHSNSEVDLTNWSLTDIAGHTFVFPGFSLPPRGRVRVWTRIGENSESNLYWGRRGAVWTNIGDIAYLRDQNGVLVDQYRIVPLDELTRQKH